MPPLRPLAILLAVTLAVSACRDDGTSAAEEQREEQLRALAADAGLDDDVADFFALAGDGATATYVVTYPGTQAGTALTITKRPPDRRVDVVADDAVVESTIERDDGSYVCRPDAAGSLACERRSISVDELGVFSEAALKRALAELSAAAARHEFRIESRTIAATDATCLVTVPVDDGEAGAICLSDEGAVLSVFDRGELLEATDYDTAVADDAFDLPS